MNIKKGDNVIISTGKDKGKKGKVLKAIPSEGRLVVEGVNLRKKRQRPRRSGEKGQVIEMPHPINVGNAMLFCNSCGKGVRIAAKVIKNKKVRVCVKCSKEF